MRSQRLHFFQNVMTYFDQNNNEITITSMLKNENMKSNLRSYHQNWAMMFLFLAPLCNQTPICSGYHHSLNYSHSATFTSAHKY